MNICTMKMEREAILEAINAKLTERGWNRHQLAKKSGVPYENIISFYMGRSTFPRADRLQQLLDTLGISERVPIPVRGVLLDGQIFPVDEWALTNHSNQLAVDKKSIKMIPSEVIGIKYAPPLPGAFGDIIAVVVNDESERPLLPGGSFIYYDRNLVQSSNFQELIEEQCVICTSDNRILMRFIYAGQLPGKYNLLSNKGVLSPDVEIKWAVPVYGYCPSRKRVGKINSDLK